MQTKYEQFINCSDTMEQHTMSLHELCYLNIDFSFEFLLINIVLCVLLFSVYFQRISFIYKNSGFDYRPFVLNWCMTVKIIDGFAVNPIER